MTNLAELAGLPDGDVDAIARVGASAMQSGRYALAVKVFTGLAALEPDVGVHRVRLAAAKNASGDVAGAVRDLDRALATTTSALDAAARVHALLLRAELRAAADRAGALADLAAAQALAASSTEAKRAFEGG